MINDEISSPSVDDYYGDFSEESPCQIPNPQGLVYEDIDHNQFEYSYEQEDHIQGIQSDPIWHENDIQYHEGKGSKLFENFPVSSLKIMIHNL